MAGSGVNALWGLDQPDPVEAGDPGITGRLGELVRYLRGDSPGGLSAAGPCAARP
jgi:hypothetical protein